MKLTKNFDSSAFVCSHCGREGIKLSLVYELQRLRDEIDLPIIPNSGYRCPQHPLEKKKLRPGRHTEGIAADIKVPGMALHYLYNAIERMGTFKGIGVDPEAGYIHVDLRPTRGRWAYKGGKEVAWNGKWETLPGAEKIRKVEIKKEKIMSDRLAEHYELFGKIRKDSPELKDVINFLVGNGAPEPEITEETVNYAGGSYVNTQVKFTEGDKSQTSSAYLLVNNPSVALVELRKQNIAGGDANQWVPYTPPQFRTGDTASATAGFQTGITAEAEAARVILAGGKNPDGSTPTDQQLKDARKTFDDWYNQSGTVRRARQ